MKRWIYLVAFFSILVVNMVQGAPLRNDPTNYNTKNTVSTRIMNNVQFTDTGFYWDDYPCYHYTDEESLKSVILCNKPECKHDNIYCMAYGNPDFQYIDGQLYKLFIDDNMTRNIVVQDKTGDNEKKVMQLSDDHLNFCSEVFEIYQDYVIFLGDYGSVRIARLGEPLENANVLIPATQKDVTPETDAGFSWVFWADAEYFYFMGSSYLRGALRPYSDKYANQLYRYDLNSGKCEKVWELPDPSEVGEWKTAGINTNGWFLDQGCLYFFLTGNGLWKTDLATGITEKLFETEDNGTAFFLKDRIYINNCDDISINYNGFRSEKRKICVYDYSGKKLKEISLQPFFNEYNPNFLIITAAKNNLLIIESYEMDLYPDCYPRFYTIDAENGEIKALN